MLNKQQGGKYMLQFRLLMTAEEVAEALGISKTQAYRLIRAMNAELAKKGYLTISGKVNRKFFAERFYGYSEEVTENARVS